MIPVTHRHAHRLVFDIHMLARLARCLQPQRIALKILGKLRNRLWHRCRKHQRAAGFGGRVQDKLQILTETQIKHLIRLVQHRCLQPRQIQRFAFDMVAQAPRCAHHDMRPPVQRALFRAVIHAAHAGRDLGPRLGIQPVQLTRHLQRQLPRRGHHQRQRHIRKQQAFRPRQNIRRNRNAKGHGFAAAGLRGHQQITPGGVFCQYRLLHGGQGGIALGCKGRCQRARNFNIGHVIIQKGAIAPVPLSGTSFPTSGRPPRPSSPGILGPTAGL